MNTKKRGDIFILLTLAYSVVIGFIVMAVLGLFGVEADIIGSLLISQLVAIGIPSLIYFLSQKDTKIPLGKLSIKEIILLVLITICITPLLNLINVLSQFFVSTHIDELMGGMLEVPLPLMLLLTALMPAIFEELLTRAIIINNYEKETVLKTMLISGLFFGFIHMNINQFLYAFIMGVIMCYVVLATESIFASMIIHFTMNASSTLYLHFSIFVQRMALGEEGASLTKFEIFQKMLEQEALSGDNQLFMAALTLFVFALFTVPIAYFLITVIVKGRGKQVKGSLKLVSGEFSGMIKKGKQPEYADNLKKLEKINQSSIQYQEIRSSDSEYSEDIDKQKYLNYFSDSELKSDNTEKKAKFFTLPLILSTLIFLIFAILNEVALRYLT